MDDLHKPRLEIELLIGWFDRVFELRHEDTDEAGVVLLMNSLAAACLMIAHQRMGVTTFLKAHKVSRFAANATK